MSIILIIIALYIVGTVFGVMGVFVAMVIWTLIGLFYWGYKKDGERDFSGAIMPVFVGLIILYIHLMPSTENFKGYECTEDCSGHEAGYYWAEENGIENIDDCGGNSNSFIEGCISYVEENY